MSFLLNFRWTFGRCKHFQLTRVIHNLVKSLTFLVIEFIVIVDIVKIVEIVDFLAFIPEQGVISQSL